MTNILGSGSSTHVIPENQTMDYNHPLYLCPTDVIGISLISFQLLRIENYVVWSRSIRLAFVGRNKIGLVDGSCRKNDVSAELGEGLAFATSAQGVWSDLKEKFDRLDGSRTFCLHKEIATLQQGVTVRGRGVLLSIYIDKKLYQFLMGLDESFGQARSQKLLMCPVLGVNQGHAMVVNDKCQKLTSSGVNIGLNSICSTGVDPLVVYSRTGGYPPDFRSKRKVTNGAGHNVYMIGSEFTTPRRDGYNGLSNESSFNSENHTKGKGQKSEVNTSAELYTGKVWEIGNEEAGLYLLSKTLAQGQFVKTRFGKIVKKVKSFSPYGVFRDSKRIYIARLGFKNIAVSRDVRFQESVFPFISGMSTDDACPFVNDISLEINLEWSDSVTRGGSIRAECEKETDMPEEPEHNPMLDQMLEEPDPEGAESQEPIEPLVTRRSTRGAHTPIWMKDFVLLNINKEIQFLVSDCVAYKHLSKSYQAFIASTSMLQEPTTYAEASKNPKWVETMKAEILALQSNNTWELSEFPKGKTAIGCRWIYKIKYKSSGEVESYKASFTQSQHDHSLFTRKTYEGTTIILVYVDDILVTGSSLELIKETTEALQQVFKMNDLGELRYFLGIEFVRCEAGMVMHQRKYALQLIDEVGLSGAKPSGTPMDVNVKLTLKQYDDQTKENQGDKLVDPDAYQKLIGKLQYLNMTRHDISFSVHTLSQFLQQPKKCHMDAVLRVVKYIKKQPVQGLLLSSSSSTKITAYCDVDWQHALQQGSL
ncbi:uncharacterized protein [Solanum lycopersicum]|uniref:uncharacterized protein n=1 Tax=Solanum lycopersicum TaxID=4081 RepID=UPI00374909C2